MQQTALLLDHLVGAGEQHCRYLHIEGLGRLEIDEELEAARPLDRQILRSGAVEHLADEGSRLDIKIDQVRAVGEKPADLGEFGKQRDGGNSISGGSISGPVRTAATTG